MTTITAPSALKLTHFIDGRWTDSSADSSKKEWRDVVNPATGEVLAQVPLAGTNEVNQAVEAAAPRSPNGAALRPKTASSRSSN